jgi:hypothetical protein
MTTDRQPATSPDSEQKVRVTIELSSRTITFIDSIRDELGFRSRGIIIEKLLDELIIDHEPERRRAPQAALPWWSRITRFIARLMR